jgi:phosphatidylglycerol:prolipoprotein diacylglycerol transferase
MAAESRMPFPPLNPIAFELGPLVVRWYALGYLAGVFGGAWYATTLLSRGHLWANNRPPFPAAAIWDFAFWAMVGIVVGGRLGYVVFYNLPYYAADPGQIVALWDGGMSFHGGLVGIIAAMWLFVRRHDGSVLSSLDLLGAIATIGIFLVRLTNFINAELYGAPTTLPWGVIFPTDPEQVPRHPTQLYEAALEGLLLFLLVMLGTRHLGWLRRPGLTAGIFGIGYALSRILVEFWRLPDIQLGYLLGTGWLTMGMVLSLPILAAGIALVAYAMARPRG